MTTRIANKSMTYVKNNYCSTENNKSVYQNMRRILRNKSIRRRTRPHARRISTRQIINTNYFLTDYLYHFAQVVFALYTRLCTSSVNYKCKVILKSTNQRTFNSNNNSNKSCNNTVCNGRERERQRMRYNRQLNIIIIINVLTSVFPCLHGLDGSPKWTEQNNTTEVAATPSALTTILVLCQSRSDI